MNMEDEELGIFEIVFIAAFIIGVIVVVAYCVISVINPCIN